MEALSHVRAAARPIRRVILAVLLVSGYSAAAQPDRIGQLERAFANGASDSVMTELRGILRTPSAPRDLRFEACMLMAECWYQRQSMEHFSACNDSAAALLRADEEERWARVEVNKCRYAHYGTIAELAEKWGLSALRRYHRAKDRRTWRYAYRIHQAVGSMYRNRPGGPLMAFAHFDTARALIAQRPDVLPYWHAMLHKSISNCAMDLMRPGSTDRPRYAALCGAEQMLALRILEHEHPGQIPERAHLQDLRGLYHVYHDEPDSALWWLRRTEELVTGPGGKVSDDAVAAAWFTALRWQAFIFQQAPWRNDIEQLKYFLGSLTKAEKRLTRYVAERTTADGRFFRDRYSTAPSITILSTCAALWALTGDSAYIDQALWSAEKLRRDIWNTAQVIRGDTARILAEPPRRMLRAVRARLGPNEAMLVCAENSLAGMGDRVVLLAISATDVRFLDTLPSAPPSTGGNVDQAMPADYRRIYHTFYRELYEPMEGVLRPAGRIRVFPSGYAASIAFDALLADTSAQDIRSCAPLVQRHAFSYPVFLLPPAIPPKADDGPIAYIAPAPGHGALTDLARLRNAMRLWAGPHTVDSAFSRSDLPLKFPPAREIHLAGHCGGDWLRDLQPRHYFGTDTSRADSWMQPSDLMALDIRADLVVHLACRSGVFDMSSSAGAFSFARTFMLAGAQNVICSQYLTDEASAVKLIDLFHKALAKGLPKDVAMQQAKLAYLEQCGSAEEMMPIHWAGWQVHGMDMRAPTSPRHTWVWLVAAIAVFLLLALAALLRAK